MASIIPGYEYDIFISYRQKDNKHDGWVTEFVKNLKGELEATFKEEISVYFDINPHDGLLETHDVADSLKDKLKCLVFIPIISRTYCDPKSFAWEHEFKAFIEQATHDQFGMKVKLPNGNVASRVLPIRIHELDSKDLLLCESALGTYLRGLEFIYKEPGVNRPLTTYDDEKINLNKTRYRNQINKVANAVNEIISGLIELQTHKILKDEEKSFLSVVNDDEQATVTQIIQQPGISRQVKKNRVLQVFRKKGVIYSLSSLGVLLAVIAFFLFSSGSSMPFVERDWIVITDFENLTNDPVFDKSLYTAFTLTISQSRYINVFPRSRMIETMSMMEIQDLAFINDKTGREIATREGIALYVVPSISEVGKKYAITAEIRETGSENLLKSIVYYAEDQKDILPKLDQLSRKIRRDLGESRFSIAYQDKPLAKVTTSSLEALKQYSLGAEQLKMGAFKNAKEYFENALRIDSSFTAAQASLGNLNIEQRFDPEKGRKLLGQAVQSANNLTDREKYGIMALHAVNVENNIPKGIEYTKTLTALYPDDPAYRHNLGWFYMSSGQYDESLKEYKEAVRINPKFTLAYSGILMVYLNHLGRADSALVWAKGMIRQNPQNPWGYFNLGSAYLCYDSIPKAESAFQQSKEIDPFLLINLYRLAHAYRLQGQNQLAINILKGIFENNPYEHSALYDLGVNYQSLGNKEVADIYFSRFKIIVWEEWMKKWPDDAGTYLAAGAISARLGETEISEQMLQRALEIDSTRHYRLACLLCLQGKVPEAIEQIENALDNGYRNLVMLKMHPDLQILQYDVRFRNLIDKYFW